MAKTAGKHTTIFINDALMTTTRPGPAWFWRTWHWLRRKSKAPWKYSSKKHIQAVCFMDEEESGERFKLDAFDATITWTFDEADEVHDE